MRRGARAMGFIVKVFSARLYVLRGVRRSALSEDSNLAFGRAPARGGGDGSGQSSTPATHRRLPDSSRHVGCLLAALRWGLGAKSRNAGVEVRQNRTPTGRADRVAFPQYTRREGRATLGIDTLSESRADRTSGGRSTLL